MSVTSVKMSEEVWLTCLTHSLSNETEEAVGFLLGDVQHLENGDITTLIWGAIPQPQYDRQKDRVVTIPDQLTAASVIAERMTMATGTRTRVVGWCHSHPHNTVLPSHIDVRTQAMYQLLDSRFVGLIFSCFNEDALKVGRIQVLAFQTIPSKITAKPPCLGGFSVNTYTKMGDHYIAKSLNDAIHNLDPMDISKGKQEAVHLPNLETRGAEYIRKEIPLHVLPSSSLLNLESPLSFFTNLQRVMYEEQKTVYNQSILPNMRNGKVHPLTFIHHSSMYRASICKMIEYCLTPAMNALQDQLRENGIKLKLLSEEAKALEAELSKGSPSNASLCSPSQGLLRSGVAVAPDNMKVHVRRQNLCSLTPAMNALQDELREDEIKVQHILRSGCNLLVPLEKCEFLALPEPGLDDGGTTSDSVLEQTGFVKTKSGSSSRGAGGGFIECPNFTSSATPDVVKNKRSNVPGYHSGFRPACGSVSDLSESKRNRRKGTPHRAPLH